MATQPNADPSPAQVNLTQERRLSYDEGWDLIFSLLGSAREMYAEVGGAEAFLRAERAAWGEDDDE